MASCKLAYLLFTTNALTLVPAQFQVFLPVLTPTGTTAATPQSNLINNTNTPWMLLMVMLMVVPLGNGFDIETAGPMQTCRPEPCVVMCRTQGD